MTWYLISFRKAPSNISIFLRLRVNRTPCEIISCAHCHFLSSSASICLRLLTSALQFHYLLVKAMCHISTSSGCSIKRPKRFNSAIAPCMRLYAPAQNCTIWEAVRDARANKICLLKTDDLIGQAAHYLRTLAKPQKFLFPDAAIKEFGDKIDCCKPPAFKFELDCLLNFTSCGLIAFFLGNGKMVCLPCGPWCDGRQHPAAKFLTEG